MISSFVIILSLGWFVYRWVYEMRHPTHDNHDFFARDGEDEEAAADNQITMHDFDERLRRFYEPRAVNFEEAIERIPALRLLKCISRLRLRKPASAAVSRTSSVAAPASFTNSRSTRIWDLSQSSCSPRPPSVRRP